ncbi:MAG: hypothetical protein WD512_01500, partial [Candidatus Paceibacterota bacterium]
MQYNRFVDNRVLQACVRPQLPKWCGPTTITELVQILLNKTICPHEVARILHWDPENIVKGMGTSAVLKGLSIISKNTIKNEIININTHTKSSLWNLIKNIMVKSHDVLYLHEQGHHVLISGFLEEPMFTSESFKNGINCQISNPFFIPICNSHPTANAANAANAA